MPDPAETLEEAAAADTQTEPASEPEFLDETLASLTDLDPIRTAETLAELNEAITLIDDAHIHLKAALKEADEIYTQKRLAFQGESLRTALSGRVVFLAQATCQVVENASMAIYRAVFMLPSDAALREAASSIDEVPVMDTLVSANLDDVYATMIVEYSEETDLDPVTYRQEASADEAIEAISQAAEAMDITIADASEPDTSDGHHNAALFAALTP